MFDTPETSVLCHFVSTTHVTTSHLYRASSAWNLNDEKSRRGDAKHKGRKQETTIVDER